MSNAPSEGNNIAELIAEYAAAAGAPKPPRQPREPSAKQILGWQRGTELRRLQAIEVAAREQPTPTPRLRRALGVPRGEAPPTIGAVNDPDK